MDDDAFGFGELAYNDEDLDYGEQIDAPFPNEEEEENGRADRRRDQNSEDKHNKNNNKRSKKRRKSRRSKKFSVPAAEPSDVQLRENNRKADEIFSNLINEKPKEESIFTTESPLDWHLNVGEDESRLKRRRLDIENAVERTAQRILNARIANFQKREAANFATTGSSPLSAKNNAQNLTDKKEENGEEKLLEIPPLDGNPWCGINSPNGLIRRYISIKRGKRRDLRRLNLQRNVDGEDKIRELEEFYELMERMEAQRRQKILLNFVEEKEEEENEDFKIDGGDEPSSSSSSFNIGKIAVKTSSSSALWTDKYAPSNFLELLTDDETNRVVLLWLRLWESCVFKRKGTAIFWESLEEKDKKLVEIEHGRGGIVLPRQKILVLYGASGVGKSSLARIMAKQAGYRPECLQISEFQNVAELRNRLENTTNSLEIQHLFIKNSDAAQNAANKTAGDRPVCFVVEGLELFSSEMIQFLCSWTRRSGRAVIRRPMICICSSIWQSPALKELRSASIALRVQSCSEERLQRRLLEICRLECIQIGQDQLSELVQMHGTDIRLCLNTLQFATANARRVKFPKQSDVANAEEPRRSVNTALTVSTLDVLYAIFTLDFHEDNRGIVSPPKKRANTILTLFRQLPQEDFVRLQQLVFINFVSVFKLGHGQSSRIYRLFVAMDHFQSLIHQTQKFVLGRYVSYFMLAVHFVCALRVSRRLKFDMNTKPLKECNREKNQLKHVQNKSNKFASTFGDTKTPTKQRLPFSTPTTTKTSTTLNKNKEQSLFSFRYSAGTSQAVRRRVSIGDIFK